MNQIKINEIFYSIQGESSWAGYPTTFIRTTGCHLRCTYCDTKYSYFEGSFLSFEEILEKINFYGARYICITGGEPLLQTSTLIFMTMLCNQNYFVSLETSGAKDISLVDPRVKIILDVKTPDSGAENSFILNNLFHATSTTEFKFVICSESDFEWAENFCRQHDLFKKYMVLYSPSYGQVTECWLAEKILQIKSTARLQLQQHKYIWSSHTRGV